jgi:hypothetical protein
MKYLPALILQNPSEEEGLPYDSVAVRARTFLWLNETNVQSTWTQSKGHMHNKHIPFYYEGVVDVSKPNRLGESGARITRLDSAIFQG